MSATPLRSALLLLSLAVCLSAHAASTPARYLVFEVDRSDAITLLGAEEVEIDGALQAVPAGGSDDVMVALRDADGRALFETGVAVDRHLRAEHQLPDGSTEGRWIERERTPFVVRLPRGGETLELTVPRSGRSAQFAVRALPRAAGAGAAGRVRVDAGGRPSNRLDLLLVGDGYTAAEQAKFQSDADRVAAEFFSLEPYGTYRGYANITSFFVPSPQSGADHPICADGGDDPLEGTFVDTAFDATYCAAGIQRLLVVNDGKVYLAAAAVPDWDKILVLVNDSMYGGAGGGVMVTSTNEAAVPIIQHEFGHGFAGLADEYSTPYPGYPPCSDLDAFGCEPNVTDRSVRSEIKWLPWIDSATPIPTPPADERIGLFLGARYQATGMYRPQFWCAMSGLGSPFCAICAQTFVLRLYEGWGGNPAGGIDPIDDVNPAPGTIVTAKGTPLTFEATLLSNERDAPSVQWLVDGDPVAGAASPTFVYTAAAGMHTVELRVTDPTALVHPAMAGSSLESSRAWTVEAAPVRKRRAAGH